MSNDGEELERLVHLIEQSISHGSTVEHDVELPVIGSQSGRTRQCDVVIRSGQEPRETITIVEVQDRASRPDINTFGGWLEKLEEVGAQHLICVSRHDFPSSIKEKAVGLGNTVRLITLKELKAENIPINFVFKFKNFDLKEIKDLFLTSSKSEAEALGVRDDIKKKVSDGAQQNAAEKCWSLDKHELISLYILCRDFADRPEGASEGEGEIEFDIKEGPELYIFIGEKFLRVGLSFKFSWTYEETEEPVSVLSYEQNEAGVLAWVADFTYQSPTGLISAKIPLVEIDGGYRIDGMFVQLPSDMELTFEICK